MGHPDHRLGRFFPEEARDEAAIARMSLIEEGSVKQVRMANLAVVGGRLPEKLKRSLVPLRGGREHARRARRTLRSRER